MALADKNYPDEEMAKIVRAQFESASKLFNSELYQEDYPLVCEIHKLFDDDDGKHHNCIACNLADATNMVRKYLAGYNTYDNIKDNYSTFIILLYLLVERVETIFSVIELHKGYRDNNFKTFAAIRKWANFIKHPKAFMLVHHPEYTFEGSPKNPDLLKEKPVELGFSNLIKYYSNDDKNKELYELLENKENVLVIFPEVNSLTQRLCYELKKFMHLLEHNEVYREILHQRATYYNFFIQTSDGQSD